MQTTNIADFSISKLDLFFFHDADISLMEATSSDVLLDTLLAFIYNFTEAIKPDTLYNCCSVLKVKVLKKVSLISAGCKQLKLVQILYSILMCVIQIIYVAIICTGLHKGTSCICMYKLTPCQICVGDLLHEGKHSLEM